MHHRGDLFRYGFLSIVVGQALGWTLAAKKGGLRSHLEQWHSTSAAPQSMDAHAHQAPRTPLRSDSVSEANKSSELGEYTRAVSSVCIHNFSSLS